jgi:hypothetical protein
LTVPRQQDALQSEVTSTGNDVLELHAGFTSSLVLQHYTSFEAKFGYSFFTGDAI